MKVTVTEPGKTEQQRALGQQIPGQQIPGQPELQDPKEPEHPAVIIEGAEGDQVLCGAPGIVKSIDVSAQTGTTVNVDIGNGYELLYGQLKEVPVKVGDYVEAKSVLGYVSQPTKYYSKEGCNVYFEMRKDGQPVNPVEYTADQD